MNRRRMLKALTVAQEIGDYEDVAVMPAETDPRIYRSRNRLPRPFYLICEKDTELSSLAGSAHVYPRNSSVNRFRMGIGDHVYVPARIIPNGDDGPSPHQCTTAGDKAERALTASWPKPSLSLVISYM
jgi:hypothetical protein